MDTIFGWYSISCCVGYVVLIVYLAIFAFDNPNPPAVYGKFPDTSEDGSGKEIETLFHSMEAGEAAGAVSLENMHRFFFGWFLWGFIQMMCLFPCWFCFVLAVQCLDDKTWYNCCGLCCCNILTCGGFVWYIMGLVWRCSQAGNFISGDIKPPDSAISDEDWIKVITNDENSLY